MQDPDLITLFVAPLEAAGIRYMITGSIASSIYGEPRNTLDIDLVLFLQNSQASEFSQIFPEEGFYLPPTDVIQIEARRETRGHFNIIHHNSGLKADIYLSQNHPYLPWAIENIRRIQAPGGPICIAPPEYVILHKLEFYKESQHQRHLRDIAGMIEQQSLDHTFLAPALQKLNLTPEYEAALALTSNSR